MVNLLRRSEGPSDNPEIRQLRHDLDAVTQRQLAEELAFQRERVERLRAERLAFDRQTTGGPCQFCGVSRQPSGVSWKGNPGHLFCAACADDLWDHTETEFASIIINRVVTGDPKSRRFAVGRLAELEIERVGFKFFHEVPGATPGGWIRWAYLDLDEVRERATPPPEEPAPRYWAGDPCEKCGCAVLHCRLPRSTRVESTTQRNADGTTEVVDYIVDVPTRDGCGGCVGVDTIEDVLYRVVGVRNVPTRGGSVIVDGGRRVSYGEPDLPTQLGVVFYKDAVIGRDRARRVTHAPWAYLPLDAIRRKAFAMFPAPSQWIRQDVWAQLENESRRGH